MPHYYPSLAPDLQKWALEQPMFCTASAPLHGQHVNLSPKGVASSTFAVLNENRVAYLDFAASGAETISHIYENGRVTIMFCSFGPKPRILRLFCRGSVLEYDDPGFLPMIKTMGLEYITGVRAVIVLDIWKVVTSCGYAVPMIVDGVAQDEELNTIAKANDEIEATGQLTKAPCKCFEDRHLLEEWLVSKTNKKALDAYMAFWNAKSLDGLPGLRAARGLRGETLWVGDVKAWTAKKFNYPAAVVLGVVIGVLVSTAGPALLPVVAQRLGRSFANIEEWALEAATVLLLKLSLCLRIAISQAQLLLGRAMAALGTQA